METEAPIQVTDPVESQDLADVKEDRGIVPATKDVLLRITKVSISTSEEDGNPVLKFLNLEARIVEGIEVPKVDEDGNQLGETEMKYKGKPMFPSMFCWADMEKKTSNWYKKKQHLVQYKYFLQAMGYTVSPTPTLTDEVLTEMLDKEIRGNIRVVPIQAKNPDTGKYENTGDLKNEVINWKAA